MPEITQQQLSHINTVFTSKYLKGKLEELKLHEYSHHHNMVSNLLLEADIPLVFMGMIMRVNNITSHIPNDMNSILVPTPYYLNEMHNELMSI